MTRRAVAPRLTHDTSEDAGGASTVAAHPPSHPSYTCSRMG